MLLVVGLAGSVVGCGSSASPSPTAMIQPTIASFRTFRDNTERYAFAFPANWHFGLVRTIRGVSVLPITIPVSRAEVLVRVQRTPVSYASLPAGKTIKTAGGTSTYRHVTISGRPAIEIDTDSGSGPTQIVSIVNGPRFTYTVSIDTPSPPLEARTLFGYRHLVSTLRAF